MIKKIFTKVALITLLGTMTPAFATNNNSLPPTPATPNLSDLLYTHQPDWFVKHALFDVPNSTWKSMIGTGVKHSAILASIICLFYAAKQDKLPTDYFLNYIIPVAGTIGVGIITHYLIAKPLWNAASVESFEKFIINWPSYKEQSPVAFHKYFDALYAEYKSGKLTEERLYREVPIFLATVKKWLPIELFTENEWTLYKWAHIVEPILQCIKLLGEIFEPKK